MPCWGCRGQGRHRQNVAGHPDRVCALLVVLVVPWTGGQGVERRGGKAGERGGACVRRREALGREAVVRGEDDTATCGAVRCGVRVQEKCLDWCRAGDRARLVDCFGPDTVDTVDVEGVEACGCRANGTGGCHASNLDGSVKSREGAPLQDLHRGMVRDASGMVNCGSKHRGEIDYISPHCP
ncbi:hypothetical protein NDU88_002733 [Pleurodeles waltl]|uniref:Uncharacterized protein n=1 Tax=Pleurodeles waltl TaxID=8319 RepID=A0AAV7SEE9_PLEWA|nr:hypothetical protein NDU88_002733 [Pleurodeles waltl]